MLMQNYSSNREISLVELKKLQWAKEKEEMAMLGKSYSRSSNQYEKTSIRSHYYSNIDLSENGDEKTYQNLISNKDYKLKYDAECGGNKGMQGSPNLPPIVHNKYRISKNNSEEETSGYMSESHPSSGSSDEWQQHRQEHIRSINHQHHNRYYQKNKINQADIDSIKLHNLNINANNNNNNSDNRNSDIYYHNDINGGNNESERNSSKYRRPNQYYYHDQSQGHQHPDSVDYNTTNSVDTPTPTTPSSVASQTMSISASQYNNHDINFSKSKEERAKWNYLYDPNSNKDSRRSSQSGPTWLEKGLIELEKSASSNISRSTSFLRGQNIPVDPTVLAEREHKRRKAMELQIAIKQQLEEREKMKKWEKERLLLEERLEEERLRKQLDNERKRIEYERRVQEEKEENKRKKEEIMRLALEKAAQDAKLEKERRKKIKGFSSRSEDNFSIDLDYHSEYNVEKGIKSKIQNEEPQREVVDEKVVLKEDQPDFSGETNNEEVSDDGEKILIGTPIKLRKKDIEKFKRRNKQMKEPDTDDSDQEPIVKEPSRKRESRYQDNQPPKQPPSSPPPPRKDVPDVNGIALLFQTITPIVPLQLHNNICFISPLANIANYPLALMLAQQNQEVTNLSNNQRNIHTPMSSEPEVENSSFPKISKETRNEQEKGKAQIEERFFDSLKNIRSNYDSTLKQTPPMLPHDGTFTKDPHPVIPRFDAATSTTDDEQHKAQRDFRAESYNTPLQTPEKDLSSVSTQTEETQNCEFCRATNRHLIHGHNKHHDVFLKETVTSVIQTKKSNAKESSADEAQTPLKSPSVVENQETMTTTTTTTTTLIRAKSQDRKLQSKLDERPKWGVNRPIMQFVKASERDAFSLRNRRKRYLKKTDETKSCELFPRDKAVDVREENSSQRNVCTEIMPIKTDGQGNVYIVRRNSFVMNESSFLNRKPNESNSCKKLLLRSSSKVTKLQEDFDQMVDEN